MEKYVKFYVLSDFRKEKLTLLSSNVIEIKPIYKTGFMLKTTYYV